MGFASRFIIKLGHLSSPLATLKSDGSELSKGDGRAVCAVVVVDVVGEPATDILITVAEVPVEVVFTSLFLSSSSGSAESAAFCAPS